MWVTLPWLHQHPMYPLCWSSPSPAGHGAAEEPAPPSLPLFQSVPSPGRAQPRFVGVKLPQGGVSTGTGDHDPVRVLVAQGGDPHCPSSIFHQQPSGTLVCHECAGSQHPQPGTAASVGPEPIFGTGADTEPSEQLRLLWVRLNRSSSAPWDQPDQQRGCPKTPNLQWLGAALENPSASPRPRDPGSSQPYRQPHGRRAGQRVQGAFGRAGIARPAAPGRVGAVAPPATGPAQHPSVCHP